MKMIGLKMAAISKKLRTAEGNRIHFMCPGCKDVHGVNVSIVPGSGWQWNGNVEFPTFSPSILVRSGHHSQYFEAGDHCWCTYNSEHPDDPSGFKCTVCHSFVNDGNIQFLDDCTHELAGKTVPLPDWTELD